MNCFLATYHPLVKYSRGREAIRRHALPPFIDGSCRREPDFESTFPSISALCRGRNFAPRLHAGDRIAYLSVKGKYPGDLKSGWRLVAILKVVLRFPSHLKGASWYVEQKQSLPSNCIVDGNPPKPFAYTHGQAPPKVKKHAGKDRGYLIQLWDRRYRRRVTKWPVFLATEPEFIELSHPPQLSPDDMNDIFGRIPGTRTPPRITSDEMGQLLTLATGRRIN
jgi:hypothetical protein